MDVYQAPFTKKLRQITQDPFAWPFEDIKPENFHSRSTLEIPFVSETTEHPIEQPMLNQRSKNILDDLFIKLRQESMIPNSSHTPEIIKTTTTVLPTEKLILNKHKTDSSLEKVVDQIMGVTRERTPSITSSTPTTTTETSFFSSTVENVTKLIEDVSAATNSSVTKKSKIHKQITNHFTGKTSSELPEKPFFSPTFVESTTSTMTEKSLFSTSIDNIRKLMDKATSTPTELPVYQSSKTNTMTTLSELTDVTTFGLNSPVNISSVDFPSRREQTSSGTNSIKDLLSFMHTTKVDPSIIQPIHNPLTFSTKSESNYFNDVKTTTGESPIHTNGSMSQIKELLNSMLTTKAEPSIIISSTSTSSTSTESNFFNQSSIRSESPIFSSSSTMESPINITMSSTVDTTNLQDIFNSLDQSEITTTTEITSAASEITSTVSEITSAVSEITSAVSEITSAVSEITSAASEITSAASEITSAASEITSAASETTIAVSEFTTPSTAFTSTTTEIINISKNVTFQTHNGTGAASPGYEGANTWVFYVILVTTILILFMVIGGVFLFYKKVKGGKGSGYQVSQMKEYNSSSGTENDTNNVKV